MRVLHPQNILFYIGDDDRAEICLEVKPPMTLEEFEFYKKMVLDWLSHILEALQSKMEAQK